MNSIAKIVIRKKSIGEQYNFIHFIENYGTNED